MKVLVQPPAETSSARQLPAQTSPFSVGLLLIIQRRQGQVSLQEKQQMRQGAMNVDPARMGPPDPRQLSQGPFTSPSSQRLWRTRRVSGSETRHKTSRGTVATADADVAQWECHIWCGTSLIHDKARVMKLEKILIHPIMS